MRTGYALVVLSCAAALFGAGVLSGTTLAQDRDGRERRARELVDASGAARLAKQACDEAMDLQAAQLPPGYAKRFKKLATARAFEKILVPVYAKHFDEDELDALIEFHRSPIGKKLVARQLDVMHDSRDAGMKLGLELGQRVMRELTSGVEEDDEESAPEPEPAPAPKKEPRKEPKKTPEEDGPI